MTLSAPCYSHHDYWRYFHQDYTDLSVLDIGSSIGSFQKSSRFRSALHDLRNARLYVSLDINQEAQPVIVGDAHSIPFPNEMFDVIFANNVIEHLHDPARGVEEMRRVLKPGAALYFTIPFLYPVHEAPNDYTRLTRFGLERLFGNFSRVEIFSRGGWFSSVSLLVFKLTHPLDPLHLGSCARAFLFPFLWMFVKFDRFDTTEAFTRVFFGKLVK